MSYIYEMDAACLRINYVVPEGLCCFKVTTSLYNNNPYNRTKMEVMYEAIVIDIHFEGDCKFHKSFESTNLQQVVEDIRKYFILNPYKQSVVEKSPDDGTESVICTA
jgi:hypothetical protein